MTATVESLTDNELNSIAREIVDLEDICNRIVRDSGVVSLKDVFTEGSSSPCVKRQALGSKLLTDLERSVDTVVSKCASSSHVKQRAMQGEGSSTRDTHNAATTSGKQPYTSNKVLLTDEHGKADEESRRRRERGLSSRPYKIQPSLSRGESGAGAADVVGDMQFVNQLDQANFGDFAERSGSPEIARLDVRALLDDDAVNRVAKIHAECIETSCSSIDTLCQSLTSLADALNLLDCQDCRSQIPAGLVGIFDDLYGSNRTTQVLSAHAVLVVANLASLVKELPVAITEVIQRNTVFRHCAPAWAMRDLSNSQVATDFPSPKPAHVDFLLFGDGTNVRIDSSEDLVSDQGHSVCSGKTIPHLESAWNMVLELHRKFCGNMADFAPGSIDEKEIKNLVAALRPIHIDKFSSRLLTLLSESVCSEESAQDNADSSLDEMKFLSLSAYPKQDSVSNKNRQRSRSSPATKSKGEVSKEVKQYDVKQQVVSDVPLAVLSLFRSTASEMFLFRFVEIADSHKLNAALAPRLSAALHAALSTAATAWTDPDFTTAVLHAQLSAKFLAAIMHCGNWSLTNCLPKSTSSGSRDSCRDTRSQRSLLRLRSNLCSSQWQSLVDLNGMIIQAKRSMHAPALVAVLLVADVCLQVAASDPVARMSAWFLGAVHAVNRILAESLMRENPSSAWIAHVPLIRIIAEQVLSHSGTEFSPSLAVVHFESSRLNEGSGIPALTERFSCHSIENSRVASEIVDSDDVHTSSADGIGQVRFGDIRLLSTCLSCFDSLRKRYSECISMGRCQTCGDASVSQSNTAGNESTGQELVDTRRDLQMSTTVPPVPLKDISAEFEESARAQKIEEELWKEFHGTLDRRVRDVVQAVLKTTGSPDRKCADLVRKTSQILIPDVPRSVVEVAAEYCSKLSKSQKTSAAVREQSSDLCSEATYESRSSAVNIEGESQAERISSVQSVMSIAWGDGDLSTSTEILQKLGITVHSLD